MYFLKLLGKFLVVLFDLLVLYLILVIAGLFWPRNINETILENGVPLLIHGDGFHSELYLPVEDSFLHFNWKKWIKNDSIDQMHPDKKYIVFGWAEADWTVAGTQDQKTGLTMTLETLLWPWNKSVMHVQFMDTTHRLKNPKTVKRYLSNQQYSQLIEFIRQSFKTDKEGNPVIKSYKGYYGFDYLFFSELNYNSIRTCNQWTANALNACGIRNPLLSPFGWGIWYQLYNNREHRLTPGPSPKERGI